MGNTEELIDFQDLGYRCTECDEDFGNDVFDYHGNGILLICWDCDVFIIKELEADLKNKINF